MDVEVIHDRDRLGPLQEEWDRLNLKAADASLFSSFDWIMAWTKSFADKADLRVVLVRDGGRLVAVAPCYLTRRCGIRLLQMLGKKNLWGTEQVSFIMEPGLEKEAAPVIFDTLLDSVGSWDALSLWGVRYESQMQDLLFSCGLRLFRETKVVTSMLGQAPLIRIDGDWEGFLRNSSRNFRKIYRRKDLAFREAGIRIINESELETHADVVERLVRIESGSWQAKRGRPIIGHNQQFFRIIIPEMLESSRGDVVWAQQGEQFLAFMLLFYQGERAWFYVTGYDPTAESLSPGAAVIYAALQQLCERGVKVVDMDIGRDDSWKLRWANDHEISLRHVFVRRSRVGRLVGSAVCLFTNP